MASSAAARLLEHQLRELGLSSEDAPDQAGWDAFLARVVHTYAQCAAGEGAAHRWPRTSPSPPDHSGPSGTGPGALLEASADLMLLVDADGRCLEVLAAGPEQPAAARQRLTGRSLHEILPGPEAARLTAAVKEAAAGQPVPVIRCELATGSGPRRFEARCVPVPHGDPGRCVLFLARELTGEGGPPRGGRLLEAVFRAAAEGIVILDSQRRVVSVNPAFERITELTARDVLGGDARFLEDVSDPSRTEELWRAVNERGRWTGELSARRAYGERYPLWVTVDAVPGPEPDSVHYLVLMSDVTALRQSRAELEYLATHDILTGMPNRRLFNDRLEGAIARARRNRRSCALLFLDLDRFKAVNDTLGHQTGDALLQAVALRLERVMRASDSLARIGGDEFTVICEDLHSEADLVGVAEKIIGALGRPFRIRGNDIELSASVGIAVFPQDGEDPDELLRHADAAMYAAKRSGRAGFRFFTRELRSRADRLLMIERRLRRMIAQGTLRLVYQPQFELQTRRLAGLEALLRLDGGEPAVTPQECIAVAEATGLINPLGQAILEEVLDQIGRWRAAGLRPPRVAVNVSRRQLVQAPFGAWVGELLGQAGVCGDALEFEITEGAFVDNEEAMQENLHALRSLGIGFAIDDFGTGHSSLVNLKRLPLDRLKIDRTFVQGAGQDPNDEAIVRATIAMAHGLGLRVVAEGVETQAQLEFLQAVGCDELQGVLWAAPEGPQEVEHRLRSRGEERG